VHVYQVSFCILYCPVVWLRGSAQLCMCEAFKSTHRGCEAFKSTHRGYV